MDVKLSRWNWGRNVGWGCFRIGCWGKYLQTKRDEVTGEWRNIRNVEFRDLFCSASIIRVIKVEWGGRGIEHIWGTVKVYTGFWWRNLRERDHLEDAGIDGKIDLILRWIFRKWDGEAWIGSIWLWIGIGGGHL